MKRRKNTFILALCLASSLLATSCGKATEEAVNQEKYISVIAKASGINFWNNVKSGVLKADEEINGITVSYKATSNDTDYKSQIAMIDTAVSDGADAIVIAPCNDSSGELNEALRNAHSSGVKIVFIVSDDGADDFKTASLETDNYKASDMAFKKAQELVGTGKIGIIGHFENSSTCTARIDAFKNKAVSVKYSNNNVVEAIAQTKKMIEENPEIALIYATNENSTKGVCQAISDLQDNGTIEKDQIQVIGFNYDEDYVSYIDSNILDGTIAQNPYKMGYDAVKVASDAIENKTVSNSSIDVVYVDKSNISTSEIQNIIAN